MTEHDKLAIERDFVASDDPRFTPQSAEPVMGGES